MKAPSLFDQVVAIRDRYGDLAHPEDPNDATRTPMTWTEIGAAINAVALAGGDGWALVAKNTGNYTMQPGTDINISRDLVVHIPSDEMYDCFRDVAGVGAPQWLYVGQRRSEKLVAPVAGTEPTEPVAPGSITAAITELHRAQVALAEALDHLNRALAQER